MKLIHITFHFEYTETIEGILDCHGVADFVRYPMMEGKDCDGKHFGTQVYPGSTSVVQAQVPEETVEAVFASLREFKEAKATRRHLEAVVLPVERKL